jgi:hypothetical protein
MMRLDEEQIEEVARAESIGGVSVQADEASGDSAPEAPDNRPGSGPVSPDAFTNGEA